MIRDATISENGKYRYTLYRRWDAKKPRLVFIGLNPSIANGVRDDNTVRRLIGFATTWGYGSFVLLNLFAYISTDWKALTWVPDPIGIRNDEYLKLYTVGHDVIIMWGGNKHWLVEKRAQEVIEILKLQTQDRKIFCFGRNVDGTPCHPLFLSRSTELVPWE